MKPKKKRDKMESTPNDDRMREMLLQAKANPKPNPLIDYMKWDNLMLVVEQINSYTEPDNGDAFCFNVTMDADKCEIHSTPESKMGYTTIVSNEHGATFIEVVYLAVLKFIEWHNKQPIKKNGN